MGGPRPARHVCVQPCIHGTPGTPPGMCGYTAAHTSAHMPAVAGRRTAIRAAPHAVALRIVPPLREARICNIPDCTAPHRTAPHRTAPHRTAPHHAAFSGRLDLSARHLKHAADLKAIFARLDVNGDGFMTAAEMWRRFKGGRRLSDQLSTRGSWRSRKCRPVGRHDLCEAEWGGVPWRWAAGRSDNAAS